MPPQVDPNEARFSPFGLNSKRDGEDIINQGGNRKGIRVMGELKYQNRATKISVKPTSSVLIIKELGNYERNRKKTKNVTHKGNHTLEQIKKIARAVEEKSLVKNL